MMSSFFQRNLVKWNSFQLVLLYRGVALALPVETNWNAHEQRF